MTPYSYPITIEREGKQYYAYSDNFPGVYGLGKTVEAAIRNILEAMHLSTKYSRRRS
jgi:predicted RNase H-like HicB family nuclease